MVKDCIMDKTLFQKALAEATGTFFLVFAGTGAIAVDSITNGSVTHMGISMIFGLVVMAMIYATGEVSGAHLNPAVTLGFFISGRLEALTAVTYIMSQTLAAILASLTIYFIMPSGASMGATVPTLPLWPAFTLEIIITLLLMFVIINVATGSRETGIMAGIAIGATVALAAGFAGPLTGASMNPARTLGPAIVSGNFSGLWIYITAPFIGSTLAVGLYSLIKRN